MPMLITDARQRDNPIAFANEAFTELTGYGREELLGRNCRMLQGPDTDPDLIEADAPCGQAPARRSSSRS